MLNLVIFGPPGTGKGTQSKNIIERYKLIHLSSGEILREEIGSGTKIGLLARKYIDKGLLVPDSVIFKQLYQRARSHPEPAGFIFDGFPRNLVQAQTLDKVLDKKNLPITLVLCMDVSEVEIYNRILLRGTHSQRSDDNAEVIRKRIEVYKAQTHPLLGYYEGQGKLFRIDGMGSIDQVFGKMCEAIDKTLAK